MKKLLLALLCIASFSCLNAQTIINPDFESSSDLPSKMTYTHKKGSIQDKWVLVCHDAKGSKGDISVSSVEKHAGDKSMEVKLEEISARYFFFLAYDLKNIAPGKYTLRFFAKANQANTPFRVDVTACSGDNYAVEKELTGSSNKGKDGVYPADRAGSLFKTNSDWKEYTVSFDASNLTQEDMQLLRLVIRPNCEKTGLSPVVNTPITYWFDDFGLTQN